MAVETVRVYRITGGDSTYPHFGTFTIEVAGAISIDDSNGFRDNSFDDFTDTGSIDVPDQDVVSSSVSEIDVGDTVDSRYRYTVTGSDGSSGTVFFIATNGTSDYGPLIVSTFPLDPAVTYTFGSFNRNGATRYDNLVVCFTAGTEIETARGKRAIETLRPGDLVVTRDNGAQPICWIGQRQLVPSPAMAPIRFAAGVLGNTRDLLVSPNHRMLIRSSETQLLFGEAEVLVAAKHLLGHPGVSQQGTIPVTYVHILFDRHEIVTANGAPSESFYPGDGAMDALTTAARAEVLHLFPELGCGAAYQLARPDLHRHEAATLARLAA